MSQRRASQWDPFGLFFVGDDRPKVRITFADGDSVEFLVDWMENPDDAPRYLQQCVILRPVPESLKRRKRQKISRSRKRR